MKNLTSIFVLGIMIFIVSGFSVNEPAVDSNTDAPATGRFFGFGQITTGSNSQYHIQNDVPRQDLSGAATDGEHIIFVDDGGKPSDFNFVRVMEELPDTAGVDLPLTLNHEDMEGATFYRDYFVATTSLGKSSDADYRRLTRFKIDDNGTLAQEQSVDLRDELMAALQANFGDDWYNRIKDEPAKSGGLNIEGISQVGTGQDVLAWGLRSPLAGDNFGNPATNPALSLSDGSAIIAFVSNPFDSNPSFSFETVDLGGHGVRGMEWIPAMGGYVIIGGPTIKANGYSLWLWSHPHGLEQLDLSGFDHLCRPESVIQVTEDNKPYLVVLSEESGAACDNVDYTYIQAEILNGHRGNGHK